MMLDLSGYPVIDTHCHPFSPGQTDITGQMLLDAITVTPPGQAPAENQSKLLSRIMIRNLARLLDCEPSLDAVIAARNQRVLEDWRAYRTTLFDDAGIAMLMIDPGYPAAENISLESFAAGIPCPVVEGYRIERFMFAGGLMFPTGSYRSFVDFVDAFREQLDQEASRPATRFFKSVIAYRTGLAIGKVSEAEVSIAWHQFQKPGDPSEKIIRDFLFRETALKAREHNIPFQVHTGHTGVGNIWPDVNPILMTPFLNDPEMAEVRFVLDHAGYPYCTEAGYLTSMYPNVALDLSLMIPWSSIGVARRIEEVLESAPTSKIMYGSDGIVVPEMYWISALIARDALGRVLERLMNEDVIDEPGAIGIAQDILYRNAERIYGVSLADG